jgi:hypothetical protein
MPRAENYLVKSSDQRKELKLPITGQTVSENLAPQATYAQPDQPCRQWPPSEHPSQEQ